MLDNLPMQIDGFIEAMPTRCETTPKAHNDAAFTIGSCAKAFYRHPGRDLGG
jgi:hypothetical protein